MQVLFYLTIFLCFTSVSFAAKGDFAAIDFIAAAPYTYDHTTGGGAYNDRTIGEYDDTVESLEGPELACGDLVTFMVQITMENTVVDAVNDVKLRFSYLADSTGQSGVAFANVESVSLNAGDVENGDDCSGNSPGAGFYGTDCGHQTNGNEAIIVHREEITGPLFKPGSLLEIDLTVTNLEAGETAILRMDVQLACKPNSSPTGNLQGELTSAIDIVGGVEGDTVSGGRQTIPLKTVAKILGLEECIPSGDALTGNGVTFTADVTYVEPGMTGGGFVSGTFAYSWEMGKYSLKTVATADSPSLISVHTFDTECTYNHDGEYLFTTGACGCEETFIGDNQPQLFIDLNTDYWNLDSAFDTEVNGIPATRYTAAGTTQNVAEIYFTRDLQTILRIVYSDAVGGRIMDFHNVVYGSVPADAFDAPLETCFCRRQVDVVVLVDRAEVTDVQYNSVAVFIGLIRDNFFQAGETPNAHMGLIEFDEVTNELLHINDGHLVTSVTSAINSLDCDPDSVEPTNTLCYSGTNRGNAAQAINDGVAMLGESVRDVPRALLVITNSWERDAALDTAVANAASAGITIFAVVWEPPYLLEQMLPLVNGNRDNLVWRYTLEDLLSIDPIDVFSKMCTLNSAPCSACCGTCDTACGVCTPVNDCDNSDNADSCSTSNVVTGDCCITVTTEDNCVVDNPGNCKTSSCSELDTCVEETFCPDPTTCHTWSCDGNDNCIRTFLGEDQNDFCHNAYCNDAGEIQVDTINPCGDGGLCYDAVCNSVTSKCDLVEVADFDNIIACNPQCASDADCDGSSAKPSNCYRGTCVSQSCEYTLDCDDNKLCTTDSCNAATGECDHTPVDCGDDNLCSTYSCDEATGSCLSQTKDCDDGFPCTKDSCDPTIGCVHEPVDDSCSSSDTCEIGSCVVGEGCVFTPNENACTESAAFCTTTVCEPFTGCVENPIDCEAILNGTSGACVVYTCDEDSRSCVATPLSCSVSAVVVAGAAIGTGLLIGIIIAAIVGFSVVGGGAYAAVQATSGNSSSTVTNNPLYEGAGKSGVNPLHQFT